MTLQSSKTNTLFVFAGEQSGDLLGGALIEALKKFDFETFGVGGSQMCLAGLTPILPMERFQVMGFSSVLKSLPRLYTDFKKIQKAILKSAPKGVVLIDYPDFNMRLAQSLRHKGFRGKIIHYVCPSVWAWRKNRVHALANTLDHLLSVLPFEKECFKKTALPVTYVGHPLISTIDRHIYDTSLKLPKPLVALFPGSRHHEIALNLPLQIKAANKLGPHYHIAISVARPDLEGVIRKYSGTAMLVPCNKRYELMGQADCAIATSGTIILELGLHSVPTVATYQLGTLNYLLGRYAFRVHLPFYTLVNILCNKEVYPEFIHKKISSEAIAHTLKNLLSHPVPCKRACAHLRQILTTQDASLQAAMTIAKVCHHEMPLP